MATYKKCDYVEIITDEFAKKGKRMTNLSKVSIERLDQLCIKYNIQHTFSVKRNIKQGVKQKEKNKKRKWKQKD